MFAVYVIFAVILVFSFVTGNVLLFVEHKQNTKAIKVRVYKDEEII